MQVRIKGEILQVFKTKKGPYGLVLKVPRPDGNNDLVTVFTNKDGYKPNAQYDGVVDVTVKAAYENGVRWDGQSF